MQSNISSELKKPTYKAASIVAQDKKVISENFRFKFLYNHLFQTTVKIIKDLLLEILLIQRMVNFSNFDCIF